MNNIFLTYFSSLLPLSFLLLSFHPQTVDVAYGGEQGFNQAIELSAETLGSVKLVQEKKLIQKWFDEIAQDTGKYCFSIKDTLNALDQGACEVLIVWDQLDADRLVKE